LSISEQALKIPVFIALQLQRSLARYEQFWNSFRIILIFHLEDLMPILAAETSFFPVNLLDDFIHGPSERHWWAVKTRPRMEKSLARQLLSLEVPFYLPLVRQTKRIARRPVKSWLPLFSSYLFVYGTPAERIETLATNRVAQMLSASSDDELTQDLKNVRALIESGVPLTTESRLQPGQRVRVKSGLLMGMEGMIVSRRGEDRLLIAVNFLQQGVSVQISDYQVEPL
jgi:transcriptional antiterminator RfaH